MIPKECKRLAEVDFPIAAVSKHAAREKPVSTKTLRLTGEVPSEVWNRLGTKLIPKLRSGAELKIGVEFSVTVDGKLAPNLEQEIRQILEDLGLAGTISLERS